MLAATITTQILLGSQFLFSTLYTLEKMSETANILEQLTTGSLYKITENYSGLIIIAPIALLALITRNLRKPYPQEIFLIVASLIGLTILTFQYRLHYFGSYALFLPLLVIFSRYATAINVSPVKGWTALLVILIMSYLPVIKTLSQSMPIGGSVDYAATRHIYPSLEKVCNEDPGIILADHNDGHYIRFHSDCSVIANNMLISQQYEEKIHLTKQLMLMSAEQLVSNAPWIKYVYVRREDNIFDMMSEKHILEKNKGLREELLLQTHPIPVEYKLIRQLVYTQPDGTHTPYARLFKISAQ